MLRVLTFALVLSCAAIWWLRPPPRAGAAALDPQKALTQYSHDIWQDRDGLPHNTVQAITQTADGYLWLGTEIGLARFDGARFVVFDRKNTPGIKNNDVTALFASRDGGLWIGTRGGGLTRLKDGRFTNYRKQDGLCDNAVRAVYEDRAGALWIGTNGGLVRLKDGQFTTYTTAEGLFNDNLHQVL
jgi:ligand-binding sensor domain-containing protein